jgi:alcohol dehydrogenase class IV
MRFEFASAGRIIFGPDATAGLAHIVSSLGSRVLVLTGNTPNRNHRIFDLLDNEGLVHTTFSMVGEPTTHTVVAAVAGAKEAEVEVVVSIGGGSAIDAGKAVAALLTNPGPLEEYLEVVGRGNPLQRRAAPHIAIATTAGTGAEVTQNAVLLVPEHKVKVSMRSPLMLPTVALIDPLLTHGMSPALTASTGLDALTQLIEAFVSKKANPLTDGVCREGLRLVGRSLATAFRDGGNGQAREDMALAALFSGLALANAGLGAVHGFAGPLGGMIDAPHGCICGKLLPHAMKANVEALRHRAGDSPSLVRFDEIGRILVGAAPCGRPGQAQGPAPTAADAVEWIAQLCQTMSLPGLKSFGFEEKDFAEVVAKARKASSMKGNPVELQDEELLEILRSAM